MSYGLNFFKGLCRGLSNPLSLRFEGYIGDCIQVLIGVIKGDIWSDGYGSCSRRISESIPAICSEELASAFFYFDGIKAVTRMVRIGTGKKYRFRIWDLCVRDCCRASVQDHSDHHGYMGACVYLQNISS